MGIHKTNQRYVLAFVLFAAILFLFLNNLSRKNTSSPNPPASELSGYTQMSLSFPQHPSIPNLNVFVAESDRKRARGLAAIDSLKEDQGMLFFFETDAYHSFWMKDMKYPIDMIWLNKEKEIVFVVENADPDDFPMTYTPDVPARYVLEVNAGFVSLYGLEKGDVLGW